MSGNHYLELSTRTKGSVRLLRRLLANNIGPIIRFYNICGKFGGLPLVGWPIKSFGRWYCKRRHGTRVVCRQEASLIIERAEKILAFPCVCRQTFKNCNRPILNCLIISDSDLFVHAGAPYAKYVSKQMANEILEEASREGMFHSIAWCGVRLYALCNCCTCCCIAYRGLMRYNIETALSQGEMVAAVRDAKCDGCNRCLQVCVFNAIKKGNGRISIDPDKCYGCGRCFQNCPQGAIRLVKRKDIEVKVLR